MKVIRLLCGFYFFLFFSYSAQAQRGGGVSTGCNLNWDTRGVQGNNSYFTGSGSASTEIPNFNSLNGQAINGWVNYVINSSPPLIGDKTYILLLQLGTSPLLGTPYTISYRVPKTTQPGLLEIFVSSNSVYSVPITSVEDITVFRIAREGSVMRFYKNDELIPVPTPVIANTSANAQIGFMMNKGQLRVNVYSPKCQQVIPDFEVTSLGCNGGVGTANLVNKKNIASFLFAHNTTLNSPTGTPQGSSLSSSVPSVGWITGVTEDYKAATYYMGIGKTITWQHTGTQLNNNILTANTSGVSLPTNLLASSIDGWIGFRNDNKKRWSVGFVDATTSTVLYEYKAKNFLGETKGSGVDIYIEGTKVATASAFLSDYLRIAKEGNTIKFYVNEVEVYSKFISSIPNLKAKFSFEVAGSSISYPTLSFCTESAEINLSTTDISVCQDQDILPITATTNYVTELRWYTTNPDGIFPRPSYVSGFSFDPDASGSLPLGVHYYYVTGIDINGQETMAQEIKITVDTTPQTTYISFIEAEIGETVNFNVVSTATIHSWTGPNGFTSSEINPFIVVNPNSYGEYTLVVRNGGCQVNYIAIIVETGIFATLKENLDASYYHTNKEGKLYFKFDEKYGVGSTGLASVSIFNYDYQEVAQRNLSKEYGYNWYGLDLSSFNAIEGDQYVLHIRDELDRRYVLRVKYVTGNNKVIISEDSPICISTNFDYRSVKLEARSYVDSSPYSIKWYTSTVSNDITQLETLSDVDREKLLFAEETDLDNQLSSTYFETNQYYLSPNDTTIYAPGEGLYYVRAIITDHCGNEAYSNTITVNVYIGIDCKVAANKIMPKKKHRFQVIFSIRRLFSPKPDTNPTVR